MNTIERIVQIALQFFVAAIAGTVCVRLMTGCSILGEVREQAKPAVVLALKEAYACGGAEAVSNRIERLVVEGKITPAQATRLHILVQSVYDGVIDRLETEILEDSASATNAVDAASPSVADGTFSTTNAATAVAD